MATAAADSADSAAAVVAVARLSPGTDTRGSASSAGRTDNCRRRDPWAQAPADGGAGDDDDDGSRRDGEAKRVSALWMARRCSGWADAILTDRCTASDSSAYARGRLSLAAVVLVVPVASSASARS